MHRLTGEPPTRDISPKVTLSPPDGMLSVFNPETFEDPVACFLVVEILVSRLKESLSSLGKAASHRQQSYDEEGAEEQRSRGPQVSLEGREGRHEGFTSFALVCRR
jgi:hypothetical protein